MVKPSPNSSSEKQLAAVMFTDIVGYTALMGKDSSKALESLKKNVEIQKSIVSKYNGKWIKEIGDGTMAQFSSAIDAVKCATAIQEASRNKLEIKLRIGIHLGDITLRDNDIFGDGVNIAARIESIADPGGVFISESVEKMIRGENVETLSMGQFELKNVDYPVAIYAVQGEGLPIPVKKKPVSGRQKKNRSWIAIAVLAMALIIASLFVFSDQLNFAGSPLNNEMAPSIAVLPFVDMSPARDQEYFSDGLSEELLNALTSVDGLKVAGRTSTFKFKGENEDIREIGRQLNVTHVLEGSVRKAGDQIRITAQLVSVEDGFHLWSETFDRAYSLENIFNVQEEISGKVLEELKFQILAENPERVGIITENIEAYELYLQGNQLMRNRKVEELEQAIERFEQAIKLDPDFAEAYARMAIAQYFYYYHGNVDRDQTFKSMRDNIDKALVLKSNIPEAYAALGVYYRSLEGSDPEQSRIALSKAHELAPNDPEILLWYSQEMEHKGPEELKLVERAYEIDPLSPLIMLNRAHLYRDHGEYDKAMELIDRNLKVNPTYTPTYDMKVTLLRDEPNGQLDSAFIVSYEAWEKDPNLVLTKLLAATAFDLDFIFIIEMLQEHVQENFPNNEFVFDLAYDKYWYTKDFDSLHILFEKMEDYYDISLTSEYALFDLLDLFILESNYEGARNHIETYFPYFLSDTLTQVPEDLSTETLMVSVIYRKLGENEIANHLADLVCEFMGDRIDFEYGGDIKKEKISTLFDMAVCPGLRGDSALVAKIVEEYHFNRKSKANIYFFVDTNAVYELVRESASFVEVRARMEEDIQRMRNNASAYLIERGITGSDGI